MADTQDRSTHLLEKKFNRRDLVLGAGRTAVTAAVSASALTGIQAVAQTSVNNEVSEDTRARRAYMEGMVDKYIKAVLAHDPGLCPLAEDVVFVENQQVLPIGDAGWQNLNRFGSYRHYFCDFEMNQVGLIANAYENDRGCVYVLRLKLDNNKISQIDQWISRDPNGAENYEKLGAPDPIWLEPIPIEQRQSREALMMNAFMYFEALERNDGTGIYPFRADCERIEHARRTVNQKVNSGYGHADATTKFVTMPARAQYEYGMMAFVTRIRDRFAPVIDVERGAVMGQGSYDFDGALKKIHFIKDDVDWTIPPYFRTARSHMATAGLQRAQRLPRQRARAEDDAHQDDPARPQVAHIEEDDHRAPQDQPPVEERRRGRRGQHGHDQSENMGRQDADGHQAEKDRPAPIGPAPLGRIRLHEVRFYAPATNALRMGARCTVYKYSRPRTSRLTTPAMEELRNALT